LHRQQLDVLLAGGTLRAEDHALVAILDPPAVDSVTVARRGR
jgi:hypothetical protein